jgi:hypothetical protein
LFAGVLAFIRGQTSLIPSSPLSKWLWQGVGMNWMKGLAGFKKFRCPYHTAPGIRIGQVVEVVETLFGDVWYGKVSGISHSYSLASAITNLNIKRPTEFKV